MPCRSEDKCLVGASPARDHPYTQFTVKTALQKYDIEFTGIYFSFLAQKKYYVVLLHNISIPSAICWKDAYILSRIRRNCRFTTERTAALQADQQRTGRETDYVRTEEWQW